MATRKVKCQGCKESFSREEEEYEKVSKGFFHRACYERYEKERSLRAGLVDYVYDSLGPTANMALVGKQIKTYTEDYNYTESGIQGTVYYFHEILKNKLVPKMGIAFVPYHYEKAKNYFEALEKTKEGLIKYEPPKEKEIVVTQFKNNKDKHKVDLESMFERGEFD